METLLASGTGAQCFAQPDPETIITAPGTYLASRPPPPPYSCCPPPPLSSSIALPTQMGFGNAIAARFSKASLAIDLPTDSLFIRGVGTMADPALLSGNVVLTLENSATIKEITLSLVGTAKIPSGSHSNIEQPGKFKDSRATLEVYSHNWTLLGGQLRSAQHTLQSGRHTFPFQVELDETTPSTLTTHNAAISIEYALKAHVTRPALAADLHAKRSVRIIRSLAPEALEFQQTHEIENTWPDKIMYSLSIPHKAWAAGDTVCALVKFSPLAKGTRVTSVVSTLQEAIKIQSRGTSTEHLRTVASIKHEFGSNGKPKVVDTYAIPPSSRSQGGMFYVHDNSSDVPGSYAHTAPTGLFTGLTIPSNERSAYQNLSTAVNSDGSSISSQSQDAGPSNLNSPGRARYHNGLRGEQFNTDHQGDQDIVALLPVTLPNTATPSHNVAPVDLTYRIRWVAQILNPDGHVSELRCSLPIIVLDHSLLTDSRLATNETRRLCFGLAEDRTVPEEIDLPSYPNHILDRVANSLFPLDAARVHNPWPIHEMEGRQSMSVEVRDDSHARVRPRAPVSVQVSSPTPTSSRSRSRPSTSNAGNIPTTVVTQPAHRGPVGRSVDWLDSEFVVSLGDTWRSSVHSRRSEASSSNSPTMSASPSAYTSPAPSEPSSRKSSRPSTASSHTSMRSDLSFASFARSKKSSKRPSTATGIESRTSLSGSLGFTPTNNDSQHLHPHYQPPLTHTRSHSHPSTVTPTPSTFTTPTNSSIAPPSGKTSQRTNNVFSSFKPLTSLTSLSRPLSKRGSSRPSSSHSTRGNMAMSAVEPVLPVPLTTAPVSSLAPSEGGTAGRSSTFLANAFNEVPDYGVASRGFLGGGVPPLDLVRNLPSYEDAQRQHASSSRPGTARSIAA